MNEDFEILEKAERRVRSEQRGLRTEREAFREFRDSISLAQKATAGHSKAHVEAADLRESYRDSVMATSEYETVYGDSFEESVKAEFPPAVANALISKETISPRDKRELLIAANESLEQRKRFEKILDEELASLRTTREETSRIVEALRDLPTCSLEETSFEKFYKAWDVSETLRERCANLVEDRQNHIAELHRLLESVEGVHALNIYLYEGLGTTYPALHAIANTRWYIERYQSGSGIDDDSSEGSINEKSDTSFVRCHSH